MTEVTIEEVLAALSERGRLEWEAATQRATIAAQRAEIEALVAQVINAIDAAAQARTPHQRTLHERNAQVLKDNIEGRVSALFGLSADDMAIVRAVPVPA